MGWRTRPLPLPHNSKCSCFTLGFLLFLLRLRLPDIKLFPKNKRKPSCNAPGGIRDYTEYVKEGNFVPDVILNPEKGVDYEIFKEKKKSRRRRGTSSSGAAPKKPEEGGGGAAATSGSAVTTANSMESAHTNITSLLNKIYQEARESRNTTTKPSTYVPARRPERDTRWLMRTCLECDKLAQSISRVHD